VTAAPRSVFDCGYCCWRRVAIVLISV
jgi:hypothetical protein